MTALLDIKELHLDVAVGRSVNRPLLKGVSFQIMPGEAYGLVGESGSGKSVTSLAVMGLLKKPLAVCGGEILFKGQNLLALPKREIRRLRGNRIAMIFQEPMTALNPLSTIGRQIAEMFVLHQGKSWDEAQKLAVDALASVRVPNPDRRARNYPHQMSGGLRQRVMIAWRSPAIRTPDRRRADHGARRPRGRPSAAPHQELCAERGVLAFSSSATISA